MTKRNEMIKIEREEGYKFLLKFIGILIIFVSIAIISVIAGLYYGYYQTGKDILYFIGNILFIYLPEFIILWYTGNYLILKERRKAISNIKRRKRILRICNTDLDL